MEIPKYVEWAIYGVVIVFAVGLLVLLAAWLKYSCRVLRSGRKGGRIAVCSLNVLALTYLGGCLAYQRSLRPPADRATLEEFIQAKPQNYDVFSLSADGGRYIELRGPMTPYYQLKALFFLHSGPPAYVFNQQGDLIFWTEHIWDSSRYRDDWLSADRTNITTTDALASINASISI